MLTQPPIPGPNNGSAKFIPERDCEISHNTRTLARSEEEPPLAEVLPPITATKTGTDQEPVNVLLIANSAETRTAMGRLLVSFGCDTIAVSTLAQAMLLVDKQKNNQRFDVLIVDLGGQQGVDYGAIKIIKQLQPGVRSIALIDYGAAEGVSRSRQAGFDRHLNKPADCKVLYRLLQELVTVHSLRQNIRACDLRYRA